MTGPSPGEPRPGIARCDECGATLEPDISCPQHWPGCGHDWCYCPSVCPDCCTDPGCPLAPQIPGQLTLDETT